jgi:SAM-dependent methyltransferase
MSDREAFLRAFHAANPGITSRVFGRGGTYARLVERAPMGRVLDLGCGDGPLLRLLGPRAVGVDVSFDELQGANGAVVQARAQELPFGDAAFDAATCHLAFMLFDDIETVVAELGRVLRPGAPFIALLGGGPTADGRDAFHAFTEHIARARARREDAAEPRFGDPRASSETGWRELFAKWYGAGDITFERWPVDLGGTFDDVWAFLSASYQLRPDDAPRIRDALRAEFSGEHVPCTVVTFCATVRR